MQSPVSSINIITAVSSKLGDISFFKKKHASPAPQTYAFIDLCNMPGAVLGTVMQARFLLNECEGTFLSTPDTQICKGIFSSAQWNATPPNLPQGPCFCYASFQGLKTKLASLMVVVITYSFFAISKEHHCETPSSLQSTGMSL